VYVIVVDIQVKPEHRDAVLKGSLEDARGSQHDEPGCLRFDVVQANDDPNHLFFYEVYRDEAAFQAHLEAPHFPAWSSIPPDSFARPTRVVHGVNLSPSDAEYR
jgi:autoinducer 2-degrading protein